MRLAVIADIHGNAGALRAVLAELKAQSPDLVVNMGDCLSGPLQARETCDLLMDLNWPTVRGNHDHWLVERAPERMGPSDAHAHAELETHHLLWLKDLPTRLDLPEGITAFHATPGDDLTYLTELVTPNGLVTRPMAEVAALVSGVSAPLALFGHTHLPRLMQVPGGPLLLNPGSVGLPAYDDDEPIPHSVSAGSPHARYALVDGDARGWSVTFRMIGYDWDAAARLAAQNGRMEWARALATGTLDWPGQG
jgi:putative phosphoesterase